MKEEGTTYINAHPGSKTPLGKKLSNSWTSPFRIKINNEEHIFQSIESLWYWLLIEDDQKEKYKNLDGKTMKAVARNLKLKRIEEINDFKEIILESCRIKADLLRTELTQNTLPIVRLKTYSERVFSERKKADYFIWEEYNRISKELKA